MVTAQTPREEREQGEDSKEAEIIQRGKKTGKSGHVVKVNKKL